MSESFTVNGAAFASAVRYVARWLPTKLSVPAHAGILFEVEPSGMLNLFAYNDAATGRAAVETSLDGIEGFTPIPKFLVSGRLLAALAPTLGAKEVTFEIGEAEIGVKAGRFDGSLPRMAESDYPTLPGLAPFVGTVEGETLADAVRRVGVAANKDGKVPALQGMAVQFGPEALTLMATDKYRVAMQSIPWAADMNAWSQIENSGGYALPMAAALVDAIEAFDADEIEVGWEKGAFSLSTPWRSLTVRVLAEAETFPAAQLPGMLAVPRSETVVLSVKSLAEPLKRVEQFRGEHGLVTLALADGTLTVSADAGEAKGRGGEEVDVDYAGPEASITFTSVILHGVLGTSPGDELTLHFEPGKPKLGVLFTSDANPEWRHLAAPIRPLGGSK